MVKHSRTFLVYNIMIANIVREKRIDLSYPIQNFDSSKEIATVGLFTDNIQYEFSNHWINLKPRSKQIKAETYTRRKLIDLVEGKSEITQFDKNPQIKRMNMLEGITEVALNLNKLKDGKPSNIYLSITWLSMAIIYNLNPTPLSIDEYFMMSHRQGNAKLEYNGVFRAQLCMIIGSRSVK